MKKVYALLMVFAICLGIVPLAVFAEEPVAKIVIAPSMFGAWENWRNSPNNPAGVGVEPGVTQLLVAITDAEGNGIDISEELTWKLTFSAGETSKTITMAPATKIIDYNLYRFEPCLGKDENQFVPAAGTDYTVQISVYDGEDLAYESAAASGIATPEGFEPQVPAQLEWPDSWELKPAFGCIENWSGNTFFIVANTGAKYESNKEIHAKLKDGTYAMKVIITDETSGKVYTIDKYMFDNEGTGNKEFYVDASFLRLAVCDYGIVPVRGYAYTVRYEITENGNLRYNATSEVGAFNAYNDAFKVDGAIVPAEAPHTCTVSDKQAEPEPTPTPTPTPTPSEEPMPSDEPTPTPTPMPSEEPTPSEEPLPSDEPTPTPIEPTPEESAPEEPTPEEPTPEEPTPEEPTPAPTPEGDQEKSIIGGVIDIMKGIAMKLVNFVEWILISIFGIFDAFGLYD